MLSRLRIVLPIVLCSGSAITAADDFSVGPLTPAQQNVIAAIDESRVLTTISFLAADEMAGRNTPSKELAIASAYVAARFRGAGLTGLGPEGSYFQTQALEVSRPPETGCELKLADGTNVPLWGVLATRSEPVEVRGAVIGEAAAAQAEELNGPVLVSEGPEAVVRQGDLAQSTLRHWSRCAREFSRKGATAILVRPDAVGATEAMNSVFPSVLPLLQNENRVASPAVKSDCPIVVLSPAADEISGKHIRLTVPAQRTTDVEVSNVIGLLPGSDAQLASEAVLITAHLDHIGTVDHGPDRINNGADDNASGVTGVLMLADAFTKLDPPPQRSMIFMTFWGEEKGLLGSKHFVDQPLWPLGKISAVVNLEMIGRPEKDAREKAWLTGWKHSNLGELLTAGSSRIGVEIFNRTDIGEMLYTRSDNAPFMKRGVIAHSVSAGSLHADYHQPGDEWTKLDIPHMTRVIQGLAAGLLPLADGEVTPEKR